MQASAGDRKRLFRSGLISLGVWLAVLLLLIFIPAAPRKKPDRDFSAVQITLTASAVPERAAQAAAVPAQQSQPRPVQQDTPRSPETASPAPSSSGASRPSAPAQSGAAAPSRTAPASSAGLGIPDFDTPLPSSREHTGEGSYLDFSSPQNTNLSDTRNSPGAAVTEFEGTAGAVEQNRQSSASVSSRRTDSGSGTAAEETARSLEQLQGAAQAGVQQGTSGATSSQTGTGPASSVTEGRTSTVGNLVFEGIPRRLLYPEHPSIELPPDLARLVDSDRSVTVEFVVRPDGTVPGGLVRFSPSAVLPPDIRNYLVNQFSRWRFEQGTQDGHARFLYSIKVQ
ncbi:hypothetical protein K7I13_04485 [Brucepastera parasyntrophica]|uniref:hypothetical protein n=1 Tax=Brucepastera parasyntrophica TaxID=2880008 RepID=UPI00210B9EE9|nr:hypothetical protein [Brucepastera parasyntrophica]ULQ60553.1 hypothetical protein K7I13_04485 [Brucepastera parasyntrophica]